MDRVARRVRRVCSFVVRGRDVAIARGVAGVAFVIALASVARRSVLSFWIDEISTVEHAASATALREAVVSDANMSGYYLVMTALGALRRAALEWAPPELVARAPSVAAAIAALLVFHRLVRHMVGRFEALCTIALVTLNPLFTMEAVDARSYAIHTLLSLVASAVFLRATEPGSARGFGVRDAVVYALSIGVGFYFHFFTVLVVPVHIVLAVARPMPRADRARFAAAVVGAALLAVPALAFQPIGSRQIAWLPKPSGVLVLWHAGLQTGWLQLLPKKTVLPYAIAFFAILVFGIVRSRREPDERRRWVLLVAWLHVLVPPLLVFVASFWRPLFYPRFFVASAPWWALLAVATLGARPASRVARAFGILLLSLHASTAIALFRAPPINAWREVAHAVEARAPTRVLVAPAFATRGVGYYAPVLDVKPGSAEELEKCIAAEETVAVVRWLGQTEWDGTSEAHRPDATTTFPGVYGDIVVDVYRAR